MISELTDVCISLVLVGMLWGATNPLIKYGSSGIENIKARNSVLQFFYEIKFLVTNWKYMVPFLLNQTGSVVYFLTLQKADLSLAVPVANSLTFVFTALAGVALGEESAGKDVYLGMGLVIAGISLCVLDKTLMSTFKWDWEVGSIIVAASLT